MDDHSYKRFCGCYTCRQIELAEEDALDRVQQRQIDKYWEEPKEWSEDYVPPPPVASKEDDYW